MSRRLDKITDEAAIWFVRAQDAGFSNEDRRELASWLAASAEHVQEYLSLAAISSDVAMSVNDADVDELIDLARKESFGADVIALPDTEQPPVPSRLSARGMRRRAVFAWGLAAAVVMAVAVGLHERAPGFEQYATGVGEQTTFLLDDGSVVSLNAQSTLQVLFDDDRRDVRLVSGEAMFDVVTVVDRPFRVSTGSAVAEAVGTQFNVRYRGSDTTVTVVEGLVDVQSITVSVPSQSASGSTVPRSALLGVGQQARVVSGEVAVVETDVHEVTSWRDRRLVFEARPLSDVIFEFNLFNDQQIFISDPGIANRAISGSFDADDRESFALFLSEAGIADYARHSDGSIELYDLAGSNEH